MYVYVSLTVKKVRLHHRRFRSHSHDVCHQCEHIYSLPSIISGDFSGDCRVVCGYLGGSNKGGRTEDVRTRSIRSLNPKTYPHSNTTDNMPPLHATAHAAAMALVLLLLDANSISFAVPGQADVHLWARNGGWNWSDTDTWDRNRVPCPAALPLR